MLLILLNPILPAIISAGAGVAGEGMNMGFQAWNNIQNRKFALDMYNKQFSDNISLWEMQNAYNSPENQRKRLEAAGLSPAMMYGSQGSGGTASAPAPASAAQYKGNALQLDAANMMQLANGYFDLKQKQANVNSAWSDATMKEINARILAGGEVALTAQPGLMNKLSNRKWEFLGKQIDYFGEFKDAQITNLLESAYRNRMQGNYIDSQRGLIPFQKLSLQRGAELSGKQSDLIDLDLNLKKFGIMPGDPWYVRMMLQAQENPEMLYRTMDGVEQMLNRLLGKYLNPFGNVGKKGIDILGKPYPEFNPN